MKVIHFSAECYPVAKVGGLGDVVGALPKYQFALGLDTAVVMPWYDRKFVREHPFETVFEGDSNLGNRPFHFRILKEKTNATGFPLYLVHIPGLLDRPEVYAYNDETEQFIAFQLAALTWLNGQPAKPDVLHCHDHHTGLIPYLVKYSMRFRGLMNVPTVATVHNAQYQGWFGWEKQSYLPETEAGSEGLLSWGGCINPLASAIKCCWRFTTVSPGYLAELTTYSNGLEYLFAGEMKKGSGIINGIDTTVWNPQTDPMLQKNFTIRTVKSGKAKNKELLLGEFMMDAGKPLLTFIGRLVGEKGADLLPGLIGKALDTYPGLNVFILGSGEHDIEARLRSLNEVYPGRYYADIGYNELLAHRLYAAADFLIMPSRVEPCGLNQLYSLRYGTIPVVRSTGGLKDTVPDISGGGYGFRFDGLSEENMLETIDRMMSWFSNTNQVDLLRKQVMALDFSWDKSANQYIELYRLLKSATP
jgi:starch synthase